MSYTKQDKTQYPEFSVCYTKQTVMSQHGFHTIAASKVIRCQWDTLQKFHFIVLSALAIVVVVVSLNLDAL